jgi:exonuclease SbcC
VRPLELEVDGFTCFRDPQPVLDLRALDLFAITGPTGAGKSSVLDAMIYALYAKVPRLGRRGVGELISQLRDQMTVRLDFQLGERRYRVARRTRRRGAGTALLVELAEGQERPVADGVREVNQRIEALLGLSYDAFQQAVVLPQGEFDRFLRSDPAERRTILRALLRLEVFERMRERAHQRAGALAEQVRAARARLDEDFAGLSEERVAALRGELDAAGAALDAATGDATRAEAEVTRLRPLRAATQERSELATQRARLRAAEAEVSGLRERVERARAAGAVRPAVEAAEAAAARAAAAASRARATGAEAARLEADLVVVRERLAAAEQAQRDAAPLQARAAALDALLGMVAHRDAVAARLTRQEGDRSATAARCGALARERAAQAARLEAAVRACDEAAAALAGVAYDTARQAALEACREPAARLAALREKQSDAAAAAAGAAVGAEAAALAATRAREAAVAERTTAADAMARSQEAARAHERLRDAHAAMHLRAGLRPGEPCPVCEHPVTTVPAAASVPALQEAKHRLDALTREHAEAQHRHAGAERAAAVAEALAGRRREEARNAEAAEAQAARDVATAQAQLDAMLRAAGLDAEGPPEDVVARELADLAGRRTRHEAASEATLAAERVLAAARQAMAGTDQEATATGARLAETDASLARDRVEHDEVDGRIRAVCPSGDPAAERTALTTRLTQTAETLASAAAAAQDGERRLAGALATASEAARTAGDEAALADRESAAGDAAVAAAGFATRKDVLDALLSEADARALGERIATHARECARADDRLAALSAVLADGEVSPAQLGAAESAARESRVARDAAVTRMATLAHQLETDQRRLETATRLRTESAAGAAAGAVFDRLATDLRSDGFQEYLLQEVFERLVADASVRLRQLTGRYTLEWVDGEFLVEDHDNARERRIVETLSGGETFLTSLALALALSEQVQRTAGAVGLDSLFIDEGFGTLDADTLDVATEAIESLQVGGRMVGIISHIRDLTARMPACIAIDKRPEGSRWSVVRN